jgi:hypothetical protein
VFTGALHWSLSRARPIQSIPPHGISVRSILILSTQLRLVVSLLLAFSPISYMHSFLLIRATCPADLIPLHLIILVFGEEFISPMRIIFHVLFLVNCYISTTVKSINDVPFHCVICTSFIFFKTRSFVTDGKIMDICREVVLEILKCQVQF